MVRKLFARGLNGIKRIRSCYSQKVANYRYRTLNIRFWETEDTSPGTEGEAFMQGKRDKMSYDREVV